MHFWSQPGHVIFACIPFQPLEHPFNPQTDLRSPRLPSLTGHVRDTRSRGLHPSRRSSPMSLPRTSRIRNDDIVKNTKLKAKLKVQQIGVSRTRPSRVASRPGATSQRGRRGHREAATTAPAPKDYLARATRIQNRPMADLLHGYDDDNASVNTNQHLNSTHLVAPTPYSPYADPARLAQPLHDLTQRPAGNSPSSNYVARLVPHTQWGQSAVPPFPNREEREATARQFAELDRIENRAAAKSLAGKVACGLFEHYFPHDAIPPGDIEELLISRPLEANRELHFKDDSDLMFEIARMIIASRECHAGTRWATIFTKIHRMQLDVVREVILVLTAERSQQLLVEWVNETGQVTNTDKLNQRLEAMLAVVSHYGSVIALEAFIQERSPDRLLSEGPRGLHAP